MEEQLENENNKKHMCVTFSYVQQMKRISAAVVDIDKRRMEIIEFDVNFFIMYKYNCKEFFWAPIFRKREEENIRPFK